MKMETETVLKRSSQKETAEARLNKRLITTTNKQSLSIEEAIKILENGPNPGIFKLQLKACKLLIYKPGFYDGVCEFLASMLSIESDLIILKLQLKACKLLIDNEVFDGVYEFLASILENGPNPEIIKLQLKACKLSIDNEVFDGVYEFLVGVLDGGPDEDILKLQLKACKLLIDNEVFDDQACEFLASMLSIESDPIILKLQLKACKLLIDNEVFDGVYEFLVRVLEGEYDSDILKLQIKACELLINNPEHRKEVCDFLTIIIANNLDETIIELQTEACELLFHNSDYTEIVDNFLKNSINNCGSYDFYTGKLIIDSIGNLFHNSLLNEHIELRQKYGSYILDLDISRDISMYQYDYISSAIKYNGLTPGTFNMDEIIEWIEKNRHRFNEPAFEDFIGLVEE